MKAWSTSRGTGHKRREGKMMVMLFYFPIEKMQNSPWIKPVCDSMTGNKDGKFRPGTINSKFSAHAQQTATHTHLAYMRIVPSLN